MLHSLRRSSTTTIDIIGFYRQHSPQPYAPRRSLEQILAWSDSELEFCHDFIQILFPLPEKSRFNYDAPIVDKELFDTFNRHGGRVDLHKNFQRAFLRMFAFYGFALPEGVEIKAVGGQTAPAFEPVWAENYKERFTNWVSSKHNHLRITRMIRSLRVLGRSDLAELLFKAVRSVWSSPEYPRCDEDSMEWWLKAIEWPLYSPPQGKEGETWPGLEWLREVIETQAFKVPQNSEV